MCSEFVEVSLFPISVLFLFYSVCSVAVCFNLCSVGGVQGSLTISHIGVFFLFCCVMCSEFVSLFPISVFLFLFCSVCSVAVCYNLCSVGGVRDSLTISHIGVFL